MVFIFRRRRLGENPIRFDINVNLEAQFLGDGYIEPWPFNLDMGDGLVNIPDDDDSDDDSNDDEAASDDDDEEEDDEDGESDNDSTSSNEPVIPFFRIPQELGVEDDDEDADYDPANGDPDNNLLWHPFEPFAYDMDGGGNLNNFMDVFRRIARGLDATRNTFPLDTLPAPKPLDHQKVDLYKGNLPPQGSLPMHRNFLVPPFSNCIVSYFL